LISRTRENLAPGETRVTLVDQSSAGANLAAEPAQREATIYVCVTCRPPGEPDNPFRPGETLADSAARAAERTGVRVLKVKCLGVCNRPPTVGLRADGSWTYVFSGLSLDDGADLVVAARMLANDPEGLLPWQGRPKSLKRGMVARVPPLDFEEEPE
jgi:predicted metal-binding protein